jgi:hypothetical protein
MKQMLFAAVMVSLVFSASAAFALGSNQGASHAPPSSGDIAQDGPYTDDQQKGTPSKLPKGDATSEGSADMREACNSKWKEASANGTTGGKSRKQYIYDCMTGS